MKRITSFILALLAASPAFADSDFTHDSQLATSKITRTHQQQCLSDYNARRLTPAAASGSLAFNETLSRQVYTTLFWENADRGVAFTLPVSTGGERAKIACFYAIKNDRLEFQLSQQINASAS